MQVPSVPLVFFRIVVLALSVDVFACIVHCTLLYGNVLVSLFFSPGWPERSRRRGVNTARMAVAPFAFSWMGGASDRGGASTTRMQMAKPRLWMAIGMLVMP